MDIRPHIFRLVDTSERCTPCHFWDGSFYNRIPYYNGKRAIVALWEAVHEGPLPKGHHLLDTCKVSTCVRLDHYRLVPVRVLMREKMRRVGERFIARYGLVQGVR